MYCNLNQIIDIALGKQQGGTLETINSLKQQLPPSNYPKYMRQVQKTSSADAMQRQLPPSNYPNYANQIRNTSNSLRQQLPPSNYPLKPFNKLNSLKEKLPPSRLTFPKKPEKKGVLGRGSFGEVTLMSGLPVVDDFSATLTSLVVSGNRVSVKNTDLDINSYLQFQRENDDILVAKYFIVDVAFWEEADAVRLMLGKLPGQIVEDCTIMQMIDKHINNSVKKTERTYYFLLEVLGKKFLLFKRMDDSLDKLYEKLTVDEKNIVFYRTALTTYAYEYHTLQVGCFHRDIKPGNILCKKTTLHNGNTDYLVLIGDFGLFTDGNEEQYGFSGTPNFMCFRNIEDIEDRCLKMNMKIDIDDISSMYDIGMFVNDIYAFIGTLEFLARSLNINALNEYLNERKNNLFLVLDNPSLYKENFFDLFVLHAPHPKNIMKIFLDTSPKISMKKLSNKTKTIYANSFIANIALHELYTYMEKTGKYGISVNENNLISVYSPNGSEFNKDLYLDLQGPFAYTYLYSLILNDIPLKSELKKDLDDFLYSYDPIHFPKNLIKFSPQIATQPRIRKRMK